MISESRIEEIKGMMLEGYCFNNEEMYDLWEELKQLVAIAEVFKDSIGNHEIPCDCSSCQIYEAWKETNA